MVHHDLDEVQSPDGVAQRESRKVSMIIGAGLLAAILLLVGGLFLW